VPLAKPPPRARLATTISAIKPIKDAGWALALGQQAFHKGVERSGIGGPQIALNDARLPVEHKGGGRQSHLAPVARQGAVVVERHLKRQLPCARKVGDPFRRVVAHGHRDGVKAALAVPLVQGHQIGHFLHTSYAGRGPEVDQSDLAAQIGIGDRAAVEQQKARSRCRIAGAAATQGERCSGCQTPLKLAPVQARCKRVHGAYPVVNEPAPQRSGLMFRAVL